MEKSIENIQKIREVLSERTKNNEKDVPQKERQKIFEYGIALNVCQKFLKEEKVKEAVYALMKYNVSLENLCSVVEAKNRELIRIAYREFFLWAKTQNIFD
ncbi:hypothetical protein PMV_168 [Port-miou virus]|uniref:Uncharacterized protein n=1 Tax=Port-miou virus TaxID=1733873 RepID=A0A0N9PM19_9VIRU|nr:hypothetical protein PMV_168 [Port-miou virus]